uniref:PIPK domain-containing protein n=1 Tax=Amorphochlora amoebiformis TaxID=1561963 RepID=A0A7S0CNK1_9EUKA
MCTCCGSGDRRKYMAGKSMAYDGKLPLSKKQKEIFSESIRRDVEFLKSHQVMDYSLLVGVQSFKTLEEAKEAGVGDNTYLCRTTDKNTGEDEFLSYHFGIVDFFQKWVLAKTIARCLKTCFCAPQPLSTVPPDIYAQQFRIHLTKKFLPIAFDPVIDSAPVPVEDSPSASITPRKGRSSGECKSIGTQGASSRASVSASGSLQGPAETGILSQRERKV